MFAPEFCQGVGNCLEPVGCFSLGECFDFHTKAGQEDAPDGVAKFVQDFGGGAHFERGAGESVYEQGGFFGAARKVEGLVFGGGVGLEGQLCNGEGFVPNMIRKSVSDFEGQLQAINKMVDDDVAKINDGSNSFNIMKDAFESKINNGLADFERTKAQLERDETDLKMFSDCQNRLKPNSISFIEGLEESEYFGQLAREESEYLSTKG